MLTLQRQTMCGRGDWDWLLCSYLDAKSWAIENGFEAELDWQESSSADDVNEAMFLRELAWVVLSAGMAERVVRSRFPAVTQAFLGWRSADLIVKQKEQCRVAALEVFAHARKIQAVIDGAERIASAGFPRVSAALRAEGAEFLESFAYVGPVTKYHLAKNLGCDVVKPDRHLLRMAAAAEVESPLTLCEIISRHTGDRVAVVDLVLWRYAAENPGYLAMFQAPYYGFCRRTASKTAASSAASSPA